MIRSRSLRRARASRGFVDGVEADGSAGMPASSAASGSVSSARRAPKYDARGLLHAVRAVAEIDRVQVRGEDLVLVPAPLELPASAASFTLRLIVRSSLTIVFFTNCCVIVEPPCTTLLLPDVRPDGAQDPAEVDAAVLVEPPVLDRDDRVLHPAGDLVGLDQDAALAAAQSRRGRSCRRTRRCSRPARGTLPDRVELRDLAGHRGHQSVDECNAAYETENREEREKPQLANPPSAGLFLSSTEQHEPRESRPCPGPRRGRSARSRGGWLRAPVLAGQRLNFSGEAETIAPARVVPRSYMCA